jgi:hypothetical protein
MNHRLRFVRDVMVIDGVVSIIIAAQLILIPAFMGWIVQDTLPLGIAFAGLGIFCLTCAVNIDRFPVAMMMVFLLPAYAFLFFYFHAHFTGPYDTFANVFFLVILGLNGAGFVVNINVIVSPAANVLLIRPDANRKVTFKQIAIFAILVAPVVLFLASYFQFGMTVRVQAPDGFTTRSSFWGEPNINKTWVSSNISTTSNSSLQVSNTTLGQGITAFRPGSFMYVDKVTHNSTGSLNYCNYSMNAASFPNGTVILSQELPSLAGVHIEFFYMNNSIIMEALNKSNSRVIINYLDDRNLFIDNTNLFAHINKTFLFQLFDFWEVEYLFDIGYKNLSFPNLNIYPNLFNYDKYVDRCNDTITWAIQVTPALQHFAGISLDFERGELYSPVANPQMPDIGQSTYEWLVTNKQWRILNEQDPALYDAAVTSFNLVYDRAATFGFDVYVVYQPWSIYDLADGDIDITRLPIYPVHPNCEYGMMSYQSNEKKEIGDWNIYKDVRDQIAAFGDKGHSILLGWVSLDPDWNDYYVDDGSLGFPRYIEQAKLAQACGIEEIFSAWLHDLQVKWGDDKIMAIHEALNEQTKHEFILQVPTWDYIDDYLFDYLENFNKAWMFAAMVVFIIVQMVLFGTFDLARKVRNRPR